MQVAIIGTGLLGSAMGERLLACGAKLAIYNRTRQKAEPLIALGARYYDSPEGAIAASDFIILMLSDEAAIRAVLLNLSEQVLHGKQLIQMGTIGPQQSRALAAEFEAKGACYAEAPVLGSLPEARSGTLICMYGGDIEQFGACVAILGMLSENPTRVGEVGQAAAMKLALNQLIASLTVGFSQSLAWVEKQGLSVELFMQFLRNSALYAPTFDKKLDRMQQRNFENPNFPTRHLHKDVVLFIAESAPLNTDTTVLAAIAALLQKTVDQGMAETDYSAVFQAVVDK